MKKKVLISGADGMLAKDMIRVLTENTDFEIVSLNKKDLDITHRRRVEEVIMQIKPDVVIHTAALTNVDDCEQEQSAAFKVNGYGTENIAYYSQKVGATFVYISSCGVFGDEIKEYREYEPVELKTVYSRSKYFGEEKTKEWSNKYFIIRPGWLFGGSKNHKKNFVYNRYKEALTTLELISTVDKYGCPTFTRHLSMKILELLNTDCYGLYHITNSGFGTRFDYVKKIIETYGLKNHIKPVDSSFFQRPAPVPDCEILCNENLLNKGFSLLPDWNCAIEEYIHELKNEI